MARRVIHTEVADGSPLITASHWNANHTFEDGPSFSAERVTSIFSVANSTPVEVVFNSELWDTDGAYSTSTGRFNPQVAGKYQINSSCLLQSDGADVSVAAVYIYKNGALYKRGTALTEGATLTSSFNIQASGIVELNGSSDYVSIFVFITRTTGPSYVNFGAGISWFDAAFLRA